MKVRILTHTPEPEKLIAAAAKLCYASAEIDELLDGLTAEKTASLSNVWNRSGTKALLSMSRSPSGSRASHGHCWHRSRGIASRPSPYKVSGM